jgi:hypothetical protein
MKVTDFAHSPLPQMALVTQHLPEDHIPDVRETTCRRLLEAGLRDKVGSGKRIAITAGSRGMGGFVDLLAGIADAVREAGGEPFIVPAMGSHGGATPEGQSAILERLGVTEQAVGAPIHATMETMTLGTAENGAGAHLDRNAAEADGIIVLGRVKTHPEYDERIASGLLKMVTIGLGKQAGAQSAHNHGLWDSVLAVPRVVLDSAKILFGVAVVENGYRQPMEIEVVPPSYDAFHEADVRLLNLAREHVATIPFEHLDLLVVDEIGKNISGSGMDLNVIGRWRATGKGPQVPNYHRIVALSLTYPSLGNGLGVGLADFTTRRFMDAYDPAVTYINLLTATEPNSTTYEGPMPLALCSDREAIEVGLYAALPQAAPRLCRIRNTAELGRFWASEALLDEVRQHPRLTIAQPPAPMPFDEQGNLF